MNRPAPHFFLLLFFIFSCAVLNAQADSLRNELRKATLDTNKIILYNKLALIPAQDIRLSIAYLDSALTICERVTDKNYTGKIIRSKGDVYSVRAMADSAAFYYEQVVNIYTLTGNWQELGMTYYSLGNMYGVMDKPDLAQKAFMDGSAISRQHKVKRSEAYCTNGLATIHFRLKNYPEAERIHKEALQVAIELDEPKLQGWVYTGLGNTMIETKRYEDALTYFTSALESYTKGNYLPGIAGAHNNIGVVYSFTEERDKAIYHYRIAADSKHRYGELNGESTALNNISQLFVQSKQADSAIFYATASLRITEKLSSLPHKQMAYGYTADAYALGGQYDSAYKYEVLFREYSDSIYSNSMHEQISEMQAKYDSDQQQQQIAMLEKDNEIGELWIYFFAAAGGLVLVLAIFVYTRFRSKKKANILLEMQNHQISEQKKEITDSILYAKRIQQALLASESLIAKHIPQHFVLYRPKDIVSGDFYWATSQRSDFWLAVCDSTGHGVPGAFMSLLNTTFLSEAINEKDIQNPGEVFDYTRKKLIENLSHDEHGENAHSDGMDGTLIKTNANSLSWSGANSDAILIRNGEITELSSDKMPVGRSLKETQHFITHQLALQKGDKLYLFTDGFADQFGGDKGKKFKHKNLVSLLLQIHNQAPEQQKQSLEQSHLQWKGNLEQVDDVLVVGLFF